MGVEKKNGGLEKNNGGGEEQWGWRKRMGSG